MSFASTVKVELGKLNIDECCKIAELSAFLQLSSEITFNSDGAHISFKTMNNTIARTFISIIKEKYDLPINLIVKTQKLTKNDVYVIVIDNANKIIEDTVLYPQYKIGVINIPAFVIGFIFGHFIRFPAKLPAKDAAF